MPKNHGSVRILRGLLCGLGALVTAGSIGCAYQQGGQMLPSAYFLKDDIYYAPPGPEFKLSKEAAAQRQFQQEQMLQQGQPRR